MHAVCHATTDLEFRSCTALLSLSVIEASKPVTIKPVSDSVSTEAMCTHYIDDLLHHYNYATTGDMVRYFIIIEYRSCPHPH